MKQKRAERFCPFRIRNVVGYMARAIRRRGCAMDHRFERRLDKFVGVEQPPTLSMSVFETAEFTATRVRWEPSETGHPTQFERADGYMICLQRREIPAHPYWVDQRPMPMARLGCGQFLLLGLDVQHASLLHSGVDCISVYMARDALRKFQTEHGFVPNGLLRTPIGVAHDDDVIRNLVESLMPAIEHPRVPEQLYVDHVALALLSRLTVQFGTETSPTVSLRGGLAPWQERRAKEMLLAHLDGSIGLETLASSCRLSRSHFARAFKVSTGVSPLRWLTAQRVERAKILLLNTGLPLEQIGDSCGFADSSHFTRVFCRATGLPPGAWRRARRS